MLIRKLLHKVWRIIKQTGKVYYEIDGDQRAASFAFYAFFSLFPLLLLLISIGARWVDPRVLTDLVLKTMGEFMPLNNTDSSSVFDIINGVVSARKSLGLVAVGGLLWSSTHFFHALVRGVNRAWHTVELDWWKVPIKNVIMLCILASAMVVGVFFPVLFLTIQKFAPNVIGFTTALNVVSLLLPSLLLFYAFVMLYKVSPRRKTHFREVWLAALLVTLALKLLQQLLLFYTNNIWQVNAIYGAMGILVVLLLWVYLCGGIIILGGCFCAAQHTVNHGPLDETVED